MESNMTTLKRRLNQAIGECRSHASVTARRLVRSTILTTGGGGGGGEGPGDAHEETLWRMSTQSDHSSKTQVRHSTISGRPFARHNRPTFSYSFEPLGPAQGDNDRQQQQQHFSGGHYNELTGNQHLADDNAQAKWSRLTASDEQSYAATSTARQSHLLTRSEFGPQQPATTCHHHLHDMQQVRDHQATTTTTTMSDNCEPQTQQTPRHQQHISPTTSGCLPQVHLVTHHHHQQLLGHSQLMSEQGASGGGQSTQVVANTSGNSMQGQYFMRSSLNESIKARRSHRRSHRRSSGAGRRLGPQLGPATRRQVRFQPIPQAINISAYSGSSSGGGASGVEDDDEPPDVQTPNSSQLSSSSISGLETSIGSSTGADGGSDRKSTPASTATGAFIKSRSHHINIKRMQQQLTRLGRKSRLKVSGGVRPAVRFSSKPFAQQFGNIKPSFASFGGKIKSFASHIQQSLGSGGGGGGTSHSVTPSTSQIPVAPPTPKLPLQKTFHLRTSAATAKHQIHLSGSVHLNRLDAASETQAQHQQHQRVIAPATTCNHAYNFLAPPPPPPATDLDDGWGSDFDDTPSNVGDQHQASPAGETSSAGTHNDTTTCSTASATTSGCYLLEIGKSSCDARAVGDVIQDQGICGQFKRLHDVSLLDIPYRPAPVKSADAAKLEQVRQHLERVDLLRAGGEQERGVVSLRAPEEGVDSGEESPGAESQATGPDEDDEAELRSLEARQGFKQVRDKLKLILDQRLACFERDFASCGGGGASPMKQPQKPEEDEPHQVVGDGQDEQPRDRRPTKLSGIGVVEVQVDHHGFDCRSNCSEASSLSSGGLDSNHSGSQDSGHSTQHSGYSAVRHHAHLHQQAASGVVSAPGGGCGRVKDAQQVGTSAETSPTNQLDSGASTCGDPEPSPPLPGAQAATQRAGPNRPQLVLSSTPKSQVPKSTQSGPDERAPAPHRLGDQPQQVVGANCSPEREERRNRFIQNRLIINNKLESMFRSRSGGLNTTTPAAGITSLLSSCPPDANSTPGRASPSQTFNSPTKSVQSCPTPTSAVDPATGRRLAALTSCQSEPSIRAARLDAATRLRLLEQQRQMSLKLKQKPRRRTAKRALNLADCGASLASCSGSSTGCNASLDNQSITTVTNEEGEETDELARASQQPPASQHHYQRNTNTNAGQQKPSRFSRNGSTRRWNQESLTKQLSMVCLRQLGRNDERAETSARHTDRNQHKSMCRADQQQQVAPLSQVPRPAMSLRQLVKEEIDDCARPGRLSTLTRNILARSDSLSSGDGEQLC